MKLIDEIDIQKSNLIIILKSLKLIILNFRFNIETG